MPRELNPLKVIEVKKMQRIYSFQESFLLVFLEATKIQPFIYIIIDFDFFETSFCKLILTIVKNASNIHGKIKIYDKKPPFLLSIK